MFDQQIKLYSGTMPATGDTAPTGVLLAEFRYPVSGPPVFDATSVGGVSSIVPYSGSATMYSTVALASGTVGYAMLGSGTNRIYCTVGTSGAEFILSALDLKVGESYNIASGAITVLE